MPRGKAAVRTPGATTENTPDLQAQGDAEAAALDAELLAGGDTEVSEGDKPAAVAPDLQSLIDAAVARELAKRDAAARRAQSVAGQVRELPSQHEVDAFAIKQEVLTKDGWVVPHAYPQPAVAKLLSGA